jgi:hypothetical protein
MMHRQDFVAQRTIVEAAPDLSRSLRLSQTLSIALLCAIASFAACSASGASWIVCTVAAIATLNAVPLLQEVVLAAR